jgi:hypothetical protein
MNPMLYRSTQSFKIPTEHRPPHMMALAFQPPSARCLLRRLPEARAAPSSHKPPFLIHNSFLIQPAKPNINGRKRDLDPAAYDLSSPSSSIADFHF